ncbi:hypothetical protein [Kitasatospora phosalacinea]|uniref:Core-binding (CB) domain-containing protein n=1 Tax=Kitasatospora phosalacinea TaxID=2065 RepID=A0A9W6PDK9_9ACTN|nr:hypothetical protein [Kitasatospora phosalacinea]GLW53044.1 hypothetical protein Kpho01_10550 [Kitasatospora phosalacinea]
MFHVRIEDRGNHADYRAAADRARTAGRTPPARYRVRWRDESGRSRSLSLPTRRLASAAADSLSRDSCPLTLSGLVDLWSATTPATTQQSGPPPRPARRPLDLHVLPRLGTKPAIAITRTDIEQLMQALFAEGRLSAATINRTLATLKRALEFGIQRQHLPRNPALGLRPVPRPAV